MKHLSVTFFLLVFLSSFGFSQAFETNIIPQPKSMKRTSGDFKLTQKTKIVATDDAGRKSAGILNDLLMKNYGFKLEYTDKEQKNNAIVFGTSAAGGSLPAEGYTLNISPKMIQIAGNDTGQFYAIQSLMQMLPIGFRGETKLPAVEITDEPRFGYRGSMIDTSRHFMPVEALKKHLDLLAQYKFNRFHWHLTDDQGWRIEIKKYPKLTEIGSKRKESHEGRYSSVFKGDGVPVEGFYTQEQIKDVVAYAKERKITIIPEIELPGHASAALAAYPELGKGCKENYDYQVKMTWGIFKEVFCPTDTTFKFLEDVLTETIQLFPESPYVHIGGDEVLKDFWKESAFVQELKQKENLKDEHEVQSYFIRRIEKFINSKGKKIIGWDEILEGGVAPNATIMSWRGEKGGIEAAKAKHDVIMTPNTYLYLDYLQGDIKYEPLSIGNFIPLERVYSYNPIPKELSADEAKYILGAQGNLWTEYIENPQSVQYMLFPRLIALSEVNWSPNESKSYAGFLRRMPYHYQLMDKADVNYRIPEPEGLRNIILKDSEKATIELKPRTVNSKIFYTLDGSNPTEQSTRYEKPFEANVKPNEVAELKVIVVNEKGRKSNIYTAAVSRSGFPKPIELNQSSKGLNFKFFKGNVKSIKDFDTATPVENGTTESLSFNQFSAKTNKFADAFGVQFDGYINVPQDEIYEFTTDAKDGVMLQINDKTVIEANNPNSRQVNTAMIPLSKGYHKISLRSFQTGGGTAVFGFRWIVKGFTVLRHSENEFYR